MIIELFSKIKNRLSKFRKIKVDDLENVSGAGEPEEFDWKTKGFVTPVKDPTKNGQWEFETIGTDEDKDIK